MQNMLITPTVEGNPGRTRFELGCPDQNRITFFFFLKPKVSWTAVTRNMRLSAGTREALLHVFRPALHSTRREQTRLTRKAEKCKFLTDLWPLGGVGEIGGGHLRWGLPCMHTDEVQTEFMTALSLPLPHHLSTHQWTLGATALGQTHQTSLIHLPPRCLCQVIAGGKRKTDQYISHGPDR